MKEDIKEEWRKGIKEGGWQRMKESRREGVKEGGSQGRWKSRKEKVKEEGVKGGGSQRKRELRKEGVKERGIKGRRGQIEIRRLLPVGEVVDFQGSGGGILEYTRFYLDKSLNLAEHSLRGRKWPRFLPESLKSYIEMHERRWWIVVVLKNSCHVNKFKDFIVVTSKKFVLQ